MNAKPSPMLDRVCAYIDDLDIVARTVADQGCGQLRHLQCLLDKFEQITLVDTRFQLSRRFRINGAAITLADYVASLPDGARDRLKVVEAEKFQHSSGSLDVILAINTFDVVPPRVRRELVRAAIRNLRTGGVFVVIIPRNDTTITNRCSNANRFLDGHVFEHHGTMTFFRNFRNQGPVVRLVACFDGALIADLSVYRHVCLLFEKTKHQAPECALTGPRPAQRR